MKSLSTDKKILFLQHVTCGHQFGHCPTYSMFEVFFFPACQSPWYDVYVIVNLAFVVAEEILFHTAWRISALLYPDKVSQQSANIGNNKRSGPLYRPSHQRITVKGFHFLHSHPGSRSLIKGHEHPLDD